MSVIAISKNIIDTMMSAARNGDLNAAIAVLNQSGLNEGQKAKITLILKESRSDMEQRIVAVFENIATTVSSAQTASSQAAPSEQQYVSFTDVSTSPLGNAHPFTIDFEGKHYLNATACFLAQQYSDQPGIMNDFTNLGPVEAAALAELTPMTKERKISWEKDKDSVLMKVLRAKFEQNLVLKERLVATGNAYLVCQGHGLYLSDNFNGAGENTLGASLMRLRGEFGGTGKVAPPDNYVRATQDLRTRCHVISNALITDIMELLFKRYFSLGDFTSLTALACLNKHWQKCSTNYCAGWDLTQLCPKLRILDAKAQGVKCEDEPKISSPLLLKWARELIPHVEGYAGVTQMTITKGTTLNQLIEIAKKEGMTVEIPCDQITENLGDVPVEQTYGILITNSVFENSRNKAFNLQKILVEGRGCEMPTVQEYVALCVLTYKVFKKYLYGHNSATFGRSSTPNENDGANLPLAVGGSVIARLCVIRGTSSGSDKFGAGGQRKF